MMRVSDARDEQELRHWNRKQLLHRHRHVSQWRRDGQPVRQRDQRRSGRPPVDAPAALTSQISHGAFKKKLRRLGVAEAVEAAARLVGVRGTGAAVAVAAAG